MKAPLLTIILHVEHQSIYTVKSILKQSFSNFQLIISDNQNVIKKRLKDQRIIYFNSDFKFNKYQFFNAAISLAKGHYICFAEAGFIYDAYCFWEQLEFMRINFRTAATSIKVKVKNNIEDIHEPTSLIRTAELKVHLLKQNPIFLPSLVFRKSFLKKHNLYFETEATTNPNYQFLSDVAAKFSFKKLGTIGITMSMRSFLRYSKELEVKSDVVRRKKLSRFNLPISKKELSLHLKLMNDKPISQQELLGAQIWFNKLLSQNDKQKLYSKRILYNFLKAILLEKFEQLSRSQGSSHINNDESLLNLIIQKLDYKTYLQININATAFRWREILCLFKEQISYNPSDISTNLEEKLSFFGCLNCKPKFDLIMINGAHRCSDLINTIKSALDFLSKNGTIICNNLLPANKKMQEFPRQIDRWIGDCWKAWVHFRITNTNLEMFVVNAGNGLGLLRSGHQRKINYHKSLSKLSYTLFKKHERQLMNVIDIIPFFKIIDHYSSLEKISLDVIMVSDARNVKLKKMTQYAIDSVGNNAKVIIIESNHSIRYNGATTIYPDRPFNYNAYLNIGAKLGSSNYVLFANNDVIFTPGWDIILISEMNSENVVSGSPVCPNVISFLKVPKLYSGNYYSYDLISHFCGWAFAWKRSFYEKVGGLNEEFNFWCSDNAVVEQLLQNNEKHILVTNSVVQHIGTGQNTLKFIDNKTTTAYTFDELNKFKKIYGKDLYHSAHFNIFNRSPD